MSPEQAQGIEVDYRTDIWALGCVLYEMVRGQRPFQGVYDKALVYEIVNQEPEPLTGVRTGVPMELEWMVGKCLAKDREDRYGRAEDMMLDLRTLAEKLKSVGSTVLRTQPAAAPSQAGTHPAPFHGSAAVGVQPSLASQQTAAPVVASGEMSTGRRRLPWAVAALASSVAVILAVLHFSEPATRESPSAQPTTRHVVTLPDSALLALGTQYPVIGFESPALALSPDGRHLVYVGQSESGTRLYHRDLSRFEDPQPIAGTEGAVFTFFSPNSSLIGFLTQDRVKTVGLDGGDSTRSPTAPGSPAARGTLSVGLGRRYPRPGLTRPSTSARTKGAL